MRMLIGVLALVTGTYSHARVRAVRHPSPLPVPESVLWIAAHPDDEAVVAPLLAKWCRQDQVRCGLLVLTRGEVGSCQLAGGCDPDINSVRSAEAGAASELFQADSILLRYRDGGGVAPPDWRGASPSQPDLVSTVSAYIQAFRPELILTFDPRHGTTCHPDHRETGRAVLEALQHLPSGPELYFLETRVHISNGPLSIGFSPGTATSQKFDATQFLSFAGTEAWDAVVWDMQRHPSQFTTEWITAIRDVPVDERAVYIERAASALQQVVAACP